MRKSQDFSVYPVSEKSDYIDIQSATRFGKIQMTTGRGLMTQSHPNGAYAVHMHIDKLVKFTLTESQLDKLKEELAKTAGSSVGSSVIKSDNTYADKFAKGGSTEDTFSNIFLSYGFKPKRSYAGIKFYEKKNSVKGVDYFGNVDLANKRVVLEDEKSNIIYDGFTISELIQALKDYGFEETDKFAKGGYVEEGEDYEYVNTFGIDQDDFEKLVDAYHKSPSYDQAERVESRLIFRKMREKYGESKIDEVGNYIHETHESHEHYAKGGETEFYGLGGDITKYKKTLISKAQKNGIYENFGEIEVNKLKDKYNYNQLVYGTPEQRQMARQIDMFDEWAMSYDGSNTFAKGGMFGAGHFAEGGEITPELNSRVVSRAEEIYLEMGGKTKADFDVAYRKAILEFGYNPEHFISTMEEIGEYDFDDEIYAKGGEVKKDKITLIFNGKEHHYPIEYVDNQVEDVELKYSMVDNPLWDYLESEFYDWLEHQSRDYEEMYFGEEAIYDVKGAIRGAIEVIDEVIYEEAPKKTTFNLDKGDVDFTTAFQ
jgi:hypothetical protein